MGIVWGGHSGAVNSKGVAAEAWTLLPAGCPECRCGPNAALCHHQHLAVLPAGAAHLLVSS